MWTGAHWEPRPGGVMLRAWDRDSYDPAHDRRARPPPGPAPACRLPVGDELPLLTLGLELQLPDDQAAMADLVEALRDFGDTQP